MPGHPIRNSGTVRRERRQTVVNLKPERVAKSSASPAWVVVDFDRRGFKCERCGDTEQHSSARGVSRLDAFALRGQAFALEHGDCKEQP